MLNLEEKKEAEIKSMVDILKQIDLPDILLLTRDANTLLMRQMEADAPRAHFTSLTISSKEISKDCSHSGQSISKY